MDRLQTLDNCFLGCPLDRRQAGQLRVDRVGRDMSRIIGSNPAFPASLTCQLKKRIKVSSWTFGDLQVDAVSGAQPEIGPSDAASVRPKRNKPWRNALPFVAKRRQFLTDDRFQPKTATSDQIIPSSQYG